MDARLTTEAPRVAGDWIKMEHVLPEKPEVLALSQVLRLDRFAVVGRLHAIWSWFDRHTQDGSVAGVTPAFLDTLVSHEGFAAAMTSVGWLKERSDGRISVPNFDRHISKSAKERALGSERTRRSRNAPTVTEASPEKRREEKRRNGDTSPLPPFDPLAVTFPPPLESQRFIDAWSRWVRHRREKRKPLTPTSVSQQLADMAIMGEERAIAALSHSIRNGWTGIFEDQRATPPSSKERLSDIAKRQRGET
jgi:hypothetical protein